MTARITDRDTVLGTDRLRWARPAVQRGRRRPPGRRPGRRPRTRPVPSLALVGRRGRLRIEQEAKPQCVHDPEETDDLLRLGLHRLPAREFPRRRSLAPALASYDRRQELDEGLDSSSADSNASSTARRDAATRSVAAVAARQARSNGRRQVWGAMSWWIGVRAPWPRVAPAPAAGPRAAGVETLPQPLDAPALVNSVGRRSSRRG